VSASRALGSSSFWWLLAVVLLGQLPVMFLTVHLVPYATDQGVSPAQAAAALGLLGLLSIPGRLVIGGAADRLGWRLSFALANFGSAAGVLFFLAVGNPITLYLTVAFYGFFHGARVPPMAGMAGFLFGTTSLGEMVGLLMGISIFLSAFAPLAAGFLFDWLGSYVLVLLISAISFTLSGLLLGLPALSPPGTGPGRGEGKS